MAVRGALCVAGWAVLCCDGCPGGSTVVLAGGDVSDGEPTGCAHFARHCVLGTVESRCVELCCEEYGEGVEW